MALASVASIVNTALIRIGENPIIDLSENSRPARLANHFYETVRDSILTTHPWNEATKRVILASSGSGEAWGFDNLFPLPADFLRLLDVSHHSDHAVGHHDIRYKVEENGIVTDENEFFLRYTFRLIDPSKMSDGLKTIISFRLSAELASSMGQNPPHSALRKLPSTRMNLEKPLRESTRHRAHPWVGLRASPK